MADEGVVVDDGIDYSPFVKATKEEDWNAMKKFLDSHPEATTVLMGDSRTALHYLFEHGNIEIGGLLVKEMKPEDLQITDSGGFTAFAYLSRNNQDGVLQLLQRMVARNADLPNIGQDYINVPVVCAALEESKNKDTINYLYSVTKEVILNPYHSTGAGVYLLNNCIDIGLFDIASELVCKFPRILLDKASEPVRKIPRIQQPARMNYCPIYALAKYFSTLKYPNMRDESRMFKLNLWLSRLWKYVKQYYILGKYDELSAVSDDINETEYDRAYTFLRLVCGHVSSFDESALKRCVYPAVIEASKNGIVEFVCEMLMANPKLIQARDYNGASFIIHAIENRHEKVYSIVYNFIGQKDSLLSCDHKKDSSLTFNYNNILQLVAKLPPGAVIDRTSGPAMAMQREILWFEELWSMAKPHYRHAGRLTPRQTVEYDLFAKEHRDLILVGERAMKETANSAAFVGALIVTITFQAAFTVPGSNNADALPVLLREIFTVCDALSLYSAIASILAIIGILASGFAETDIHFKSPRRLMIGLWSLWFSLLTMMIGFCAVLALTLDGLFHYILPVMFFLLIPVILFMSPIFPLCLEIYRYTCGTDLFDKTSSLQDRIDKNMAMRRGVDAKKLPAKVEENVKSSNPSTGNNEIV